MFFEKNQLAWRNCFLLAVLAEKYKLFDGSPSVARHHAGPLPVKGNLSDVKLQYWHDSHRIPIQCHTWHSQSFSALSLIINACPFLQESVLFIFLPISRTLTNIRREPFLLFRHGHTRKLIGKKFVLCHLMFDLLMMNCRYFFCTQVSGWLLHGHLEHLLIRKYHPPSVIVDIIPSWCWICQKTFCYLGLPWSELSSRLFQLKALNMSSHTTLTASPPDAHGKSTLTLKTTWTGLYEKNSGRYWKLEWSFNHPYSTLLSCSIWKAVAFAWWPRKIIRSRILVAPGSRFIMIFSWKFSLILMCSNERICEGLLFYYQRCYIKLSHSQCSNIQNYCLIVEQCF